jgi:phytoene desaturase
VRVVVIGAGFGGLAAAIRLRARGHEVVVVEKRDKPGGRAYVFEKGGFVFDAGPTIITAPQFLDELFALSGRRREELVRLVPLDPFYRVRFEDGTAVACTADEQEMERQVAGLSPGDLPGYRRFTSEARRIFDRAMPLIDAPAGSLAAMWRFVPALIRTRAWQSVAALAERCVRDARLRQLLSFHPLLIGGHPFHAPSLYALIPELERRWGVWYALGGTGTLVSALVRQLEQLGGRLRLGCEVSDIAVDPAARRATAVRLRSGETIAADVVVSNADAGHTCGVLLDRGARRRALRRSYRYGMSVFVLYFGTDRRYDELGHHEILMGPRYRALLDDVFRVGRLSEDFSLYIHHPTVTDPSLSPAGCDTWYALVPVPNLKAEIDWNAEGNALRDRIVEYLEAHYLPDLSRHIVVEHRVDPRYFRDELNTPFGSAFSVEPVLTQSAWFRPHNAPRAVRNLYLVGAGTHPGAGIPGVLSSARITDRLIAEQWPLVEPPPQAAPSLPISTRAVRTSRRSRATVPPGKSLLP